MKIKLDTVINKDEKEKFCIIAQAINRFPAPSSKSSNVYTLKIMFYYSKFLI